MRHHFKFFIMTLVLSSCVSVQLPSGKVTQAKDVQYKEPGEPYAAIKTQNADKTWLSSKTGNTISYLSECGGTGDSSLQSIEGESLSAMSDLQVVKSEELTYNGREARQTIAAGSVDGVSVQIILLIFKKNGCTYSLSYGGLKKQFSRELPFFEFFKQEFRAP